MAHREIPKRIGTMTSPIMHWRARELVQRLILALPVVPQTIEASRTLGGIEITPRKQEPRRVNPVHHRHIRADTKHNAVRPRRFEPAASRTQLLDLDVVRRPMGAVGVA